MENRAGQIFDNSRKLTYQLVRKITNDFRDEIGRGASGRVYKGFLEDGEAVAVKVFHYNLTPEISDQQFQNEFESLKRLKHPNIVRLVGFCYETEDEPVEYKGEIVIGKRIHRALCLEYVPNCLHNKLCSGELDNNWPIRYKIIQGICNGLKHLREGLDVPIFHFDLKPSNILLDEKMVPKITDFGLSRFIGEGNTMKTKSSLGTLGYTPPEFIHYQIISEQYDIYSLGVIIAKIITGITGYCDIADMSAQKFIDNVHENWKKSLQGIPNYEPLEVHCKQVKRCIEIAINCMQEERRKRPTINDIVRKLDETETVEKDSHFEIKKAGGNKEPVILSNSILGGPDQGACSHQILDPVGGGDEGSGHALQLFKVAGEAWEIGRVSVPTAVGVATVAVEVGETDTHTRDRIRVPPLGSLQACSHQLLHPIGGDEGSGHVLQLSKVAVEARVIGRVSVPTAVTDLVMYSRALISMLFLGRLGELALAGGSLALGFNNITGYSVLSGLALGMEPISCGQDFAARRGKLLALALHRTVLLLLAVAVPISALWVTSTGCVLKLLGQEEGVADAARTFATYASADLAVLAVLHPLRVYLRSLNLTLPITACSLFSVLLHGPINYFLVVRFQMGVAGVALAIALTDLNLLLALVCFLAISGAHRDSWVGPTLDCLRGWPDLLRRAVPTATAVCLEWWWYGLMIVLSGLLANPRATVASMGILIQATSLVHVFPSSLGQGTSTHVSRLLGARRPAEARRAAGAALSIGVGVGLAAAAFMVSVRSHWGRMFTSDADILRLTAVALPIAGLCELGNCPQTAGRGVLRGSARPAFGTRINLNSFYLVGMPVGVALAFRTRLGFAGLWLGLLAAQAACAIWMALAVATTDWDFQVERARALAVAITGLDVQVERTTALAVAAPTRAGWRQWSQTCSNHSRLETLEEGLVYYN